ncbi:MAG: TonB family protein [Agarilytica sp.]
MLSFAMRTYADPLLNGVATHSELGKEQFVAGLFTTTLSTSANSILSSQENKRLQVRVLANQLSSRRFRRMWIEGMAINSSPSELEKHARDMANFSNMLKIKMISGDIFTVDRREDNIQVSVNGILLGEIEDPQFFDLLLRTWIGPVPLSSDFRKDLLTEGSIKPGPLTRFESTRPSDERIAAIESAVASKRESESNNAVASSSKPKVAVAPPVTAIVDKPSVPVIQAPSASVPKLALAPPGLESPEIKPTPKPKPKPKPVALAPAQQALDESIFDDGDDDEFTAESLLKEQLYYSQLAKYTHKYIEYPAKAWDRGREGNIRLRVTINRKGKVTKTEILEEAKYKSLNKEAKRAVSRASPYPAIPDEVKGEDYNFTFRIAFKIKS